MPTLSGMFRPATRDAGLSQTPAPTHTVRLPLTGSPTQRRVELGNDPRLVAPLIAQLRDDLLAVGACDEHDADRAGIALEEALLNAIYHGNLEISSELKENGDEPFHALARQRQALPPFRDRKVWVESRVMPKQATFVIADEGPGFDVASLPAPTDPENLLRPSGRGLLLMRAFMDEVSYNSTGNRVTLRLCRKA